MIKINLLPVKEKKRRQQILIAVYVCLALLLVVAALGVLLSTRYQKVSGLKMEISKIDEESAGYQEKIREIKDLEVSQARLDGFRKIARGIEADQKKLIGSLDMLASQMPSEVWFYDLTQGRDRDTNNLTLHGYSLSQPMLEMFSRKLGRPSGFLAAPVLTISSANALQGGNRVYQFEIKTSMVAPQ